jgi:hypothetical protein
MVMARLANTSGKATSGIVSWVDILKRDLRDDGQNRSRDLRSSKPLTNMKSTCIGYKSFTYYAFNENGQLTGDPT